MRIIRSGRSALRTARIGAAARVAPIDAMAVIDHRISGEPDKHFAF
jgi:hypothetical protein